MERPTCKRLHSFRRAQRRWAASLGAAFFSVGLLFIAALNAAAETAAAGTAPISDPSAQNRDAARAKLTEGIEFMKVNDAGAALKSFQEAYALFPSPKIFYNLALAHAALGQKAKAKDAFERFLSNSADPNPASVSKAQRELANLERELGTLKITCDVKEGVMIVDEEPSLPLQSETSVSLEPGDHKLEVRAGGRSLVKKLVVRAGEHMAWSPQLDSPAGASMAAAPTLATPAVAPAVAALVPAAPVAAIVLTQPLASPPAAATNLPLYKRWWLWTGVAVAIVACGTALLASRAHPEDPVRGSFGSAKADP